MYKELEATKIMHENEQMWRHCEGAKAVLEESRASAVVAAEEMVEVRRQTYERMAEEACLGERLIDMSLCDTDPFMRVSSALSLVLFDFGYPLGH